MDQFTTILQELGQIIDAPLHPDQHGACKLNINDTLHVQIELLSSEKRLLIACMVCEIPAGKFRENILKDGLKANWPYPIDGTLSYSEKNNRLCLFEKLSLENLTGQKLMEKLKAFITKADNWRTGVEMGQTGTLVPSVKRSGSGIFGLY